MSNFLQLAKTRFSNRSYLPKEVDKELVLKILEAARIAPSAVNKQPSVFYVIQKPDELKKIYECYPRDWFKTAPMLIIACANHELSWKRADGKDHADIDITIAVDHMVHTATDLGLSTCWVCNFNRELLTYTLNLPSYIEPVIILPIGYSAEKGNPDRHITTRKPLKEFVHWGI